jgi:hypothetical protein
MHNNSSCCVVKKNQKMTFRSYIKTNKANHKKQKKCRISRILRGGHEARSEIGRLISFESLSKSQM